MQVHQGLGFFGIFTAFSPVAGVHKIPRKCNAEIHIVAASRPLKKSSKRLFKCLMSAKKFDSRLLVIKSKGNSYLARKFARQKIEWKLTWNPSGDIPLKDRSHPQFSKSPLEQARVKAWATPALEMAWTKADSRVPLATKKNRFLLVQRAQNWIGAIWICHQQRHVREHAC